MEQLCFIFERSLDDPDDCVVRYMWVKSTEEISVSRYDLMHRDDLIFYLNLRFGYKEFI